VPRDRRLPPYGAHRGDRLLQPSVAQFGERAEVLGNEVLTHPAQVHHVQMDPPELTQVLLDLAALSPAL